MFFTLFLPQSQPLLSLIGMDGWLCQVLCRFTVKANKPNGGQQDLVPMLESIYEQGPGSIQRACSRGLFQMGQCLSSMGGFQIP